MRVVAAIVALLLTTATPARALTITGARIDKGSVQVKGKGATPLAPLTWEGAAVGVASKSGAFKFSSTLLPADCVGTVGDGAMTAEAVIAACGPQGPPGPPGDVGPPGQPGEAATGRTVVVVDNDGVEVGTYLESFRALVGSPLGLLPLRVHPDSSQGFERTGGLGLYFVSDDCTGSGLLRTEPPGLFRRADVVGTTAYVTPLTGTGTMLSPASFLSTDPVCANGTLIASDQCCRAGQSDMAEYAAPLLVDVSGYVPPFRIELR